ncbi:MAG: MFS transporter [Clostridia bacterium]|nr:MFS transporter [Clostridia bacterium]
MDDKIRKEINQTRQIQKFSAYGFLKNLKFFEPYLVIYLLGNGYSLFQIGILYSIREAIIYVFEVPSGIIADYYGRKKELYMCFAFYIISFVLFYFGTSYWKVVMAMLFFGLGEAFRSGTHKAMIYTYLEARGWSSYKAYVYGRTRSFSLIGSAVNAIGAIVLILNVPSSKYIFLASVMPYILDFALIATYPDYLDSPQGDKGPLKDAFSIKGHLSDIYKRFALRKIVINSGLFEAVFKSVKDMIQPILEIMIVTTGIVILKSMSPEDNLHIILGLSYAGINLISAYASKHAYLLKKHATSSQLLNRVYLAFAAVLFGLFIAIRLNWVGVIVVLFIVIYMLRDIRKPLFVDACDDYMEKNQRATVLSIESQLKALFTVVLAPSIGFLADQFGIATVMLASGVILILLYTRLKVVNE